MSNVEYYERWLEIKKHLNDAILEDSNIQHMAANFIGVKPQRTAVDVCASVYCKYCELYNRICECYDQMEQVQRRPYIKKIIDALTCRIIELKATLEEVEVFEYTYPDNALQQLLMIPTNIEILCPFFYPFEIRSQELQTVMDEIYAGNRLGDSPSEIERREEERLEMERILQEEKEAEIRRKLALDEEIVESIASEKLTPEEAAALERRKEFEFHLFNIQRMERSRKVIREKNHKINKDADLYLELSGLKKPQAKEDVRLRATQLIQKMYRKFMEIKRAQQRQKKLEETIGMVIPSYTPVSAKVQLQQVEEKRREFRRNFYQKWLEENIKENSRVLKLREANIIEDISDEIRGWLQNWYRKVKCFDEFPWPGEGGSILIVRGETMTIEEYIDWKAIEEKRLKAEAGNPKTKEQIKQEKLAAKLEKKKQEADFKEKERKRIMDYKKLRMSPDNDPGVYYKVGNHFDAINLAWNTYQNQWNSIDVNSPVNEVMQGYLHSLITENAYHDIQFQLRPIVDDMMRLEYNILKKALKEDLNRGGITTMPLTQKRKKPKKVKAPKPDPLTPETMFQELADAGLVRTYPKKSLDDYWGDKNWAAADLRAVLWTPSFPPPCLGDVKEQIRIRCILSLGAQCDQIDRTHLIVGPVGSGKKSLVYAIASETNALLVDLSPLNMCNKFVGVKPQKRMFMLINKISRLMQPTIIYIQDAEKMFYKKVPPEEKKFDPTRLGKVFLKEVVKPLQADDRVLIIGTSSAPWLAKPPLGKLFPTVILIPLSDYGSISFILRHMLMEFHHLKRNCDIQSVAQTLRGYDTKTIVTAVNNAMKGKREAELYFKPLEPVEVLKAVIDDVEAQPLLKQDFENFYLSWYHSYGSWGTKLTEYLLMLESQLKFKMKADKKKEKK